MEKCEKCGGEKVTARTISYPSQFNENQCIENYEHTHEDIIICPKCFENNEN